MTAPPRVMVAIPTRDRPDQITRCLASVLPQLPDAATVVVADNGSVPWAVPDDPRVRVIRTEPGYCAARNALLDQAEAAADLLIFVDDDQEAGPGWYAALRSAHAAHPGMVITGSVTIRAATDVADQAIRDALRRSSEEHPDGPVPWTATGIGNTALPMDTLRRIGGPRFDPMFSATGGEDTDFLRRLADHGVRIHGAPQATVVETYPPERLTRAWFSSRARLSGRTDAARRLAGQPATPYGALVLEALARMASGGTRGLATALVRRRWWPQDFSRFWRGVGQAQAVVHRVRGRP